MQAFCNVFSMRKETGWRTKRGLWNWRKFLTLEEAAFVKESDAVAANLERLRQNYNRQFGAQRQVIVNRAIHRAKYDARKTSSKPA